MHFLRTPLFLAALLASASVVAASEHNAIHAPAVRHVGSKRSSKCSAGGSQKVATGHKSSKKASTKSSSSSKSDSSSNLSESVSVKDAPVTGNKPKNLKGKAGLAWPNSNGMDFQNFMIGNVNWFYTWAPTAMKTDAGDAMFCSMLWGRDSDKSGSTSNYIKEVYNQPEASQNSDKCTMGMNEVNQKGQADMGVGEACSLMRKYQLPLKEKHGYYLVGPSTTSAPNGLDWYKQFKSQCSDVFNALDAVALHWYDVKIADFKAYVENWHSTLNKDIWVTEYACQNFNGGAQCSSGQARDFYQQAGSFMDSADYVKAYSAFSVMQNLQGVSEVNRMSNGNNPNSLFHLYASA